MDSKAKYRVEAFLRYPNGIRKLFGNNPPMSLDTNPQEIIDYCLGELEPERLTCDGERSRADCARLRKEIEFVIKVCKQKLKEQGK